MCNKNVPQVGEEDKKHKEQGEKKLFLYVIFIEHTEHVTNMGDMRNAVYPRN
jgi:hypothetical protein